MQFSALTTKPNEPRQGVQVMGPSILFDKSFLQMLNADEAAIFDCLFSAIIAPIFYAEVLADLSKESKGSKTAEGVVAGLARKTPVMHSTPHPLHASLVAMELQGEMNIRMEGVPYRSGGRAKRDENGKVSILYDNAPEAEAFNRWQGEEFDIVERDFAAEWREQLAASDHATAAKLFKSVLAISNNPKNFEQAFDIAQKVVSGDGQRFLTLKVAHMLLGLDGRAFGRVVKRWQKADRPLLPAFAPYTAYCLLVDTFFHVCIDKKLISPDRPSNRIDIAYLYYLPFCRLFVSNDWLHRDVAPLFMRSNQHFVSGEDLKADLAKLDVHFSAFPEEQLRQGLFRIAKEPPDDSSFLTTRLWKEVRRDHGGWPTRDKAVADINANEESRQKVASLLAEIKELDKTATQSIRPGDREDAQHMVLKRMFPLKRGKWQILPDGIKGSDEA